MGHFGQRRGNNQYQPCAQPVQYPVCIQPQPPCAVALPARGQYEQPMMPARGPSAAKTTTLPDWVSVEPGKEKNEVVLTIPAEMDDGVAIQFDTTSYDPATGTFSGARYNSAPMKKGERLGINGGGKVERTEVVINGKHYVRYTCTHAGQAPASGEDPRRVVMVVKGGPDYVVDSRFTRGTVTADPTPAAPPTETPPPAGATPAAPGGSSPTPGAAAGTPAPVTPGTGTAVPGAPTPGPTNPNAPQTPGTPAPDTQPPAASARPAVPPALVPYQVNGEIPTGVPCQDKLNLALKSHHHATLAAGGRRTFTTGDSEGTMFAPDADTLVVTVRNKSSGATDVLIYRKNPQGEGYSVTRVGMEKAGAPFTHTPGGAQENCATDQGMSMDVLRAANAEYKVNGQAPAEYPCQPAMNETVDGLLLSTRKAGGTVKFSHGEDQATLIAPDDKTLIMVIPNKQAGVDDVYIYRKTPDGKGYTVSRVVTQTPGGAWVEAGPTGTADAGSDNGTAISILRSAKAQLPKEEPDNSQQSGAGTAASAPTERDLEFEVARMLFERNNDRYRGPGDYRARTDGFYRRVDGDTIYEIRLHDNAIEYRTIKPNGEQYWTTVVRDAQTGKCTATHWHGQMIKEDGKEKLHWKQYQADAVSPTWMCTHQRDFANAPPHSFAFIPNE